MTNNYTIPEADIGFDIDGVVADIESILRREILKEYDYDINTKNTYYIKIPGVKENEHTDIVYGILEEFSETATPYEGVVDALETLYDRLRKPIPFITARDPDILKEQTFRWIKKTFPTIETEIYFYPSSKKAQF